ncbi:MAG: hypothetical protein K2X11_13100 [Acetobacteraceae bacterium]|nr:hypothetical protein [Acetobacteraceae bacterium]
MNIPLPGPIPGLAPVARAAARPAATGGGSFAGLVGQATTPRAAPADAAPVGDASALFLIQATGEQPPRRRRPIRELASHAVDLLGDLQRHLLGDGTPDPVALDAAAAEAEDLAAAAPSPEARRLCAAVALRLRVERAKLDAA